MHRIDKRRLSLADEDKATAESTDVKDLMHLVGMRGGKAATAAILLDYIPQPAQTQRFMVDCEIRQGRLTPLKPADCDLPIWPELAVAAAHMPEAQGHALQSALALQVAPAPNQPIHMLIIPDSEIIRILTPVLNGQSLSPSELRVLKQIIGGMDLSGAARSDGVGHETKRSQFKSLARKLASRSQTALIARVLPLLLLDPQRTECHEAQSLDDYFAEAIREFIPSARFFHLGGTGAAQHRFVELGPLWGRPVAFIHPQILPDFRSPEIALLHEYGLRLIVPLRNGAVSRNHQRLQVAAHLDHACAGIDLVTTHFTAGRLDIIACVSGCAYAVEYARRMPDRVRSLTMVGAPVLPVTDRSIAGRLRRGLFSLGTRNWDFLTAALRLYGERIARPATFRRLLLNHYAPSLSDLAIVEAEYASRDRGERGRKLFTSSIDSIAHDFHHQMHPRWDKLPDDRFPTMFVHGTADFIHPLDGVNALARSMGGLTVQPIEHAGQLLYHQHFGPVLQHCAAFVASEGGGTTD